VVALRYFTGEPAVSLKDLEGYAEGEKPLVFYYNREERLTSAPQNVRDYYAGKSGRPVKGLFKVLVATRVSRVLFVTIIALCAIIIVMSLTVLNDSSVTVAGIPAELTVFSFDGSVYVSLKLKETAKGINGPLPVDAHITFYGQDREFLNLVNIRGIYEGKQEFLRTTTADYGILEVDVSLTIRQETGTLRAKVIQK
jgi:hypothetical protein